MERRVLTGMVVLASIGVLAALFVNLTGMSDLSAEEKAVQIYKRLAGRGISPDDPLIQQMISRINSGDVRGAGRLVIDQDSGFYNLVVKDMFTRMSTRDELVSNQLSDFVATGIGVVRDDLDARELLTGNYTYRGVAGLPNVRANIATDILASNNHYVDLINTDLKTSLVKFEPQQVLTAANAPVANPDPAGLLSSRGFLGAHAIAGTNRRIIEFTFREFLCVPIEGWSDPSAPDNFIGQDVERFPEGSNAKFQSNCRACHAQMDPLRGAFANVVFDGTKVIHSGVDLNTTFFRNAAPNVGIAIKYLPTGANQKFPSGYAPTDTRFQNYAITGVNASYFGWDPTKLKGSGMNAFGDMIANSRAFPRCLVRRAFREVCKRSEVEGDAAAINAVTNEFVSGGYKLKTVFEALVARPECLGQ